MNKIVEIVKIIEATNKEIIIINSKIHLDFLIKKEEELKILFIKLIKIIKIKIEEEENQILKKYIIPQNHEKKEYKENINVWTSYEFMNLYIDYRNNVHSSHIETSIIIDIKKENIKKIFNDPEELKNVFWFLLIKIYKNLNYKGLETDIRYKLLEIKKIKNYFSLTRENICLLREIEKIIDEKSYYNKMSFNYQSRCRFPQIIY